MNTRSTLKSYVDGLVAPVLRSVAVVLDMFKQQLTVVKNDVTTLQQQQTVLEEQLDGVVGSGGVPPKMSTLVPHPAVTVGAITPDMAVGTTQAYVFSVPSVTLNVPVLPEGATAGRLSLYVKTTVPDTWVTLGTGLRPAVGGDGFGILGSQEYLYIIDVKRESSVTTGIIRSHLRT